MSWLVSQPGGSMGCQTGALSQSNNVDAREVGRAACRLHDPSFLYEICKGAQAKRLATYNHKER
jgi:hypothetical protein